MLNWIIILPLLTNSFLPYFCCLMFLVYCMFCFATTTNVYSQGNRKCSFLPGCACLYLYWLTHITCFENADDDDDDDDDD